MTSGAIFKVVVLALADLGAVVRAAWNGADVADSNMKINLKTGKVSGFSEFVFFDTVVENWPALNQTMYATSGEHKAATGCTMRAVLKIKMSDAFDGVHFRLFYHRPKLWTFHLSSDRRAVGFGGRSRGRGRVKERNSHRDRDRDRTELQVHNRQLRMYGRGGPAPIKVVDEAVPRRGSGRVSLHLDSRSTRWRTDVMLNDSRSAKATKNVVGAKSGKTNGGRKARSRSWSFESDVAFDSIGAADAFLYVGLNRAIGSADKAGSGLCGLAVTLQKAREKRDECRFFNNQTCHEQAQCKKVRNMARCACRPGFLGDGLHCVDDDECDRDNGHCVQKCINTPGGFSCACFGGFRLAPNGFDCEDVDECAVDNGKCLHRCVNTIGGYECSCRTGFVLGADGYTCFRDSESDKCQKLRCAHGCGTWASERGEAACVCKVGFELQPNGRDCAPTCQVDNGGCQHKCVAGGGGGGGGGGASCACHAGYLLARDNKTCVASCSVENGGCERTCRDTALGAQCSCPAGFGLNVDGKTCSDVDECSTNNGGCEQTCLNEQGGFECSCDAGYALTGSDERRCADVDECSSSDDDDFVCEQVCVNTPGAFQCRCRPGFQLVGARYCGDVDECSDDNGLCQFGCVNTPGSYHCVCPDQKHHFLSHPNGKDCLSSGLLCCIAGVADDKIESEMSGWPQGRWAGAGAGARAESALLCASPSASSSYTTCMLTCHRRPSLSYQPGAAFDLQCDDQSGFGFDSNSDWALASASALVDSCHLRLSHSPLDSDDKSRRQLMRVVQFSRLRVSCRPAPYIAGAKLLTVDARFRFSSFLGNNSAESSSFSQRFVSLYVEWLVEGALRRRSLSIRHHALSYEINFSTDRISGCAEDHYFNTQSRKCVVCSSEKTEARLQSSTCAWRFNSADGSAQKSVSVCRPGWFSADGWQPCTACPIGTYQNDWGRISCRLCPFNRSTGAVGSTSIDACSSQTYCGTGRFLNVQERRCAPCPRGSYQPLGGRTFCISCPQNSTTDSTGSVAISACKSTICTHLTTKNGGYSASPNYPGDYPADSRCSWDIKAPPHHKILLFIPDLTLAPDDHCGDYLVIRKNESPYSTTSFESCDSFDRPVILTARSRRLVVHFGSNARRGAMGFRLFYAFYRDNYESLVTDVISDERLHRMISQRSAVLANVRLVTSMLDVLAEPTAYRQLVNSSTMAVLPKSFVDLLWPKISRFFDLIDV